MKALIGGPPKPSPECVARLKGWIADRFQLAEATTIMVSELHCHEDDCPDVETVIAILDGPGSLRWFKLKKPVEDVLAADIQTLETEG